MVKKSLTQRREEYALVKKEKSEKRRARKLARSRGEEVTVQKPRKIEDMRERDESIVPVFDKELLDEECVDEFKQDKPSKLMIIVASERPGKRTLNFLKELVEVVPNLHYFKKKTFPIKKIVEIAKNRDFTSLLVLQEHLGCPASLYVISLPVGPTSYWKLTGLKLGQEIKQGTNCNSEHLPEIICKNFTTRLGLRVKRQLCSLFPSSDGQAEHLQGRRVITFHNQRDFIFFRHYRYQFKENTKNEDTTTEAARCVLQEIGPRFTMKMHSLQIGTFNKNAEYEFIYRPDSQVSRKCFSL